MSIPKAHLICFAHLLETSAPAQTLDVDERSDEKATRPRFEASILLSGSCNTGLEDICVNNRRPTFRTKAVDDELQISVSVGGWDHIQN